MTSFKASSMSKALKLTWKKKSVDGYQIQYSLNKDFKSAKTIKVSKSKTSYTIKSLKANKKYYVRIRSYKNYTDDLNNEQTVYGKWVSLNKQTK
ncbi:MAG: fibronectin type III domain-containing protein [Acetivibrio ethanolgignens]